MFNYKRKIHIHICKNTKDKLNKKEIKRDMKQFFKDAKGHLMTGIGYMLSYSGY